MIKPYMDGIPDGIVLGAMQEDVWNSFFFAQKTMYEQRIEQKRIEDDQRVAAEKKAIEDQKKKDAEALRIKKELDAKNKQIEAEKKIRDERAKEIAPYVIFIRDYNGMLGMEDSVFKKELLEIKKAAEEHFKFEKEKSEKEAAERDKARKEKELADAALKKVAREFMNNLSESDKEEYRFTIRRSLGFAGYKLNIACSEFGEAFLKATGLGNWVSK
jgi:hypothetical protein